MNANLPFFHQQFYRAYLLLAVAISLLLLSGFALMKVREHNYEQQLALQLPAIQKSSKQLSIVRDAEQHLQTLLVSEQATDFVESHQALEKQLLRLSKQLNNLEIADFPYLAQQSDANQIVRIAGKDSLNRDVIAKALSIIALVETKLNALIDLKSKRADELFNLIKNERAGEATTSSRAKAHAQLVTSIKHDLLALNTLKIINSQLALLNLQTPQAVIEQLGALSAQFFEWYEKSEKSIASDDRDLAEQLTLLKRSLIIDDRVIAKWRGHLRLYRQYQNLLLAQQKQLAELGQQLSSKSNASTKKVSVLELLPSWLQRPINNWGISLNHQVLQLTLLVFITLLLTAIILVLFWLNRRIQDSAKHQVAFIEQSLTNNDDIKIESIEKAQIFERLSALAKPKYSEQDVENMLAKHREELQTFGQFYQMVNWSLLADENNDNLQRFLSNSLAIESFNSIFSLRKLLSAEQLRTLIKAFKHAKTQQQAQSLVIEYDDKKLLLVINYSAENGYSGALGLQSNNENEKLQTELTTTVETLNNHHLDEKITFAKAVNSRVIQAMLQCQAECLTRKTETPSLYRQLQRMLVWGQETYLDAKIHQDSFQLVLTECQLQTQILTALANLTTEFKGLKNQYQLRDKLSQNIWVQIDTELFTAAILGIARLMVARQRNSELLISAKLKDKNDGQYIVSYQFSLTSSQKVHNVPTELKQLVANAHDDVLEDSAASHIENVMQRLFAQELLLVETEHGYQLSFELPHTKVTRKTNNEQVSLSKKQFIYLSDETEQNTLDKLVISAIEQANGRVDIVNSDNIYNVLSVEQLKLKPCHALISCNIQEYQQLVAHIDALPQKLAPKIYCLAGKAHVASSLEFGIFSQLSIPFNQQAMLTDLAGSLSKQAASNLVINQSELQQQFVDTGVELLFAAEDYSLHNVLIQLLNYLGFSVKVAASKVEMAKLWRSGRYLIVISDFNQSPIVDFDNGKQVKRGVLALNKADCKDWQKQAKESFWTIEHLPDDYTVSSLQQLLHNWLVIKELPVKEKVNKPISVPVLDSILPENFTSLAGVNFDDLPAAINLQRYADNQAGAELAAMMLDDYVAECGELIPKISFALSVKSVANTREFLDKLLVNARILAADNLVLLCQQLFELLAENHYQDCQDVATQMAEEIQLIAQYAEAI